jgi:methylmalonyl-CoA/ethylmalonyl-CoA epimerase
MERIEHIGIAVKNLDQAEAIYEALLGTASYKREEVASENVITSFFKAGQKIELLASTTEDGVIARFIEKRGEGIHHIAFHVDDIYAEMQRLREAGFTLLQDQPKKGADGKLVCFVHPKGTGGVLVELCTDDPDAVTPNP